MYIYIRQNGEKIVSQKKNMKIINKEFQDITSVPKKGL